MSIKSAASSAPSSASASAKIPPTQKPAKMSNGMPKPVCSSSPAALTSLCPPGPIPSRHNSVASQRGSWVADEISLGEIFRLIAQMKICVIRRAGSDIEGQITSIIDSAASGRAMANGTSSEDVPLANAAALFPVAHFLSVGQQSAGQMLDCVGRMGLPLIFLNGDCVGGLNELKLLEKSGFLGESLGTHKFDLIVVGGGGENGGDGNNEAAENAVEEAVLFGKRVAYVELAGKSSNGTTPAGTNSRLAKEAANQAALMRTAIEEARASGWTVEGEQGAKVSFWLDWPTVREGILCRAETRRQRMEATFRLGKVQCFRALACQFSGFHELTLCPDLPTDSEQFKEEGLLKLSADRFLLAIRGEPKTLENVPGARECAISNSQLFSTPHNPGKTLFCCENASDPAILESASILRALGNDVTVMCCSLSNAKVDKPSSFDAELVEHIKEKLASERGVRFVLCVPTKFEQLREPAEGKAGIVRVLAMSTALEGSAEKLRSSNNNGSNGGEWSPFLEEFNTVVLSLGHRSEPFQGLGLDKLSVLLAGAEGKSRANSLQKSSSTSLPNIYAFSDTPQGASNAWSCFGPRQLLRRMFQGELSSLVESDLCRTLLLPPLEYSCCGLTEQEAQKRYGKEALSVYRDGQVPLEGVAKAKMICLKPEQERVIGLHILGPDASKQLQGYALAMQLGLGREKMESMRH